VGDCFFTKQIIAMTKAPNDLTSLGAYFMLIIKTKERKRENPSLPKQRSPLEIRAIALTTNYYDKIIFTTMQVL